MKTVIINYLEKSNLFQASKWLSWVLLRRRVCSLLAPLLALELSEWFCMGR
jgi:hypothetical protein